MPPLLLILAAFLSSPAHEADPPPGSPASDEVVSVGAVSVALEVSAADGTIVAVPWAEGPEGKVVRYALEVAKTSGGGTSRSTQRGAVTLTGDAPVTLVRSGVSAGEVALRLDVEVDGETVRLVRTIGTSE